MMGTLATGLAGRKIPTHTDRYTAHVEGDIEDVDGVLRITRIRVDYCLKVPPGKMQEARDVFAVYLSSCPGAMSVQGCIEIVDYLDVSEIERA
jgi:hypothetical protein